MDMLLDTKNCETIYKSLELILGIPDTEIYSYAKKKALESDRYSKSVYSDEKEHFLNWINSKVVNKEDLDIDNVTIFHYARRLETAEELKTMPLYNLKEIVNSENKITSFLKEYNIRFVSNDDDIKCFYKGVELDFLNTRNRLNKDRCINGYLFGGEIYKETEISGIKFCPEFIQDIEKVIKEQILGIDSKLDLQYDYQKRSKSFIFKVRVPIDELIFDRCRYGHEGEKKYNIVEIYNNLGSCLINKMQNKRIRNRIIRLKDDATVKIDDVLDISEVPDDKLYDI
ncbi:MAG: hypothetical protein GX366_08220 [Epulopiscium sp.]|nr:hypothetical protein [Candidatus Epulonipiscium sp.]